MYFLYFDNPKFLLEIIKKIPNNQYIKWIYSKII